MLSEARAARLAWRAERRKWWWDYSPSRRARRAWEVLVEAGNHGDPVAIRAVFKASMDSGKLRSFARPDSVTGNDLERAFFLVLTGQPERHLAIDPEGTLVALAYSLATERTQAELRQSLVEVGHLHIARNLMTHGGRRVQHMSATEIDYLAQALANHREWAQLWRLVRDAPLESAVAAMPLFQGWRPADDAGAALFARLAAVDSQLVSSVTAKAINFLDHTPSTDLSFAPDGTQIAVSHDNHSVAIYAVPDGRRIARYPARAYPVDLLHLGDAVVVFKETGETWLRPRVVRSTPERRREVFPGVGWGHVRLAKTPEGFVVATDSGLQFGTAFGLLGGEVLFDELGLGRWRGQLAADPVSGRLAITTYVGDEPELALLDAELRVIARTPLDKYPDGIRVCGPELVLTWNSERTSIRSWRRSGDSLVLAATAGDHEPDDALPLSHGVGIRRDVLEWYDPETLTGVAGPAGFRSSRGRLPALSPCGNYAAVESGAGVLLRDLPLSEIDDLVTRPMAGARPTWLRFVAALEGQDLSQDAGAVVELLRACLEYRLGAKGMSGV